MDGICPIVDNNCVPIEGKQITGMDGTLVTVALSGDGGEMPIRFTASANDVN